MKIGIFAGTFDPVHNGHLAFAQMAITEAGLDRIVIVAEKEPYRKKPHVAWDHRQAMIERATEGVSQVDHNYQFAAELARQHTMKNLLQVAERHYGKDNEFWFLAGSDIYEHIHQWHDLAEDKSYAGFVVALRDNHTENWLAEKQALAQQHGISGKTIIIANHHPHISSSKIRAAAINHDPTDLPPKVYEYITTHQLYS